MSLNDIQIPPVLLAELYGNTMIIGEKINAALMPRPGKDEGIKEVPKKNFLGENRRNILIVVSDPAVPVISDTDLKLLTDILGACKLGLADVIIVNIAGSGTKFNELKKEFSPVRVLLFGISQEEFDLPARFPDFQVQALSGPQFLSSPPLPALQADKLLKSKLWVSLQKLFNL